MKKDIKRLRELDAIKESKKIIEVINKPQDLKPEPKEVVQKVQSQVAAGGSLEKAEQYATEEEKQKIFLLKSKKADLENELGHIAKEAGMIFSQKEKLLAEQKTWQDKLNLLLEKETTAPESQKDVMEKQKWPTEKKITDLENTINAAKQNWEILKQKETNLQSKITEVETALKDLYGNALKRNMNKKRVEATPPPVPKPQALKPQQKESQQPKVARPSVATLGAAGDLGAAPQPSFKEKVQEMNKRDEDQRRKFMEDVEAWAQNNK